jgi:hypothetical protein
MAAVLTALEEVHGLLPLYACKFTERINGLPFFKGGLFYFVT